MTVKKILAVLIGLGFLGIAGIATTFVVMSSNLPQLITVEDYQPLVASEVFDREGRKIGEFFREKRMLVAYEQMPKILTQAFIASEDSSFYDHEGINYMAIVRAFIANLKAGRKVQGGSTITMQVARSLLLSSEKTYTRKIKEVILSKRMEANLSKEEILYLYLNQIYLGQGSYGVGAASKIYFRKPIQEITLGEAALLAGLPQAPSRYSPIYNPQAAKERQKYVLRRMAEEGYVTDEQANAAAEEPLTVYVRKNFEELAPYYLETVRQMLVDRLGEEFVLDKGIKVFTGLDLPKQLEAQAQVRAGLRQLDKRQGYRGPAKNLQEPEEVAKFLLETRNALISEHTPVRVIQPDGSIPEPGPLNLTGKDEEGKELPVLPEYITQDQVVDGIVTKVDDEWGLVTVRFAETKGLIDMETMEWARKPDPNVHFRYAGIEKPSEALAKGDVIQVRVVGKKFYSSRINEKLQELKRARKDYNRPESLPEFSEYALLELEQEPTAEGSLLSIDQRSSEVIAMVGGYDFERSQFNRSLQAARQTGSAFKALVYASALDKDFTPATPIIDAPIVFEEEQENPDAMSEEETVTRKWKPMNHSNKFSGDILFRNALIRSLNVPTIKVIEKIGVEWVADYARRLGIFSPLNMDLTLALGSSGVTLYEMTKVFSEFGRLGRKVSPVLIHKVEDQEGNILAENITLDERFTTEMDELNKQFEERRLAYLNWRRNQDNLNAPTEDRLENKNPDRSEASTEDGEAPARVFNPAKEPPFFFEDPNQLIKPTTAYIITTLLQGVVEEKHGTGQGARALGRPVAGKTGTTNGYYDGWFVGYTPDIATGVWVGFDDEKSLGQGEVGGRAALPIWIEYMKSAHEGTSAKSFPVPEGIVFANIDNETGKLASAASDEVVRQAFVEGTEPSQISSETTTEEEDKSFFKEDLSE